jgi:hypothetical protein
MSTVRWTDRELREFVLRAPRLNWDDQLVADLARSQFHTEALERIVPVVQERLLAEGGVPSSADGIALLACEIVEDSHYERRREWLLVCAEPWEYLATWIADSVVKSYKTTIGKSRKDRRTLAGIAEASSRPAIDGPSGE